MKKLEMAINASKRHEEIWIKAMLDGDEISNYEVSNTGRVKSSGKILKGSLIEGYARINLNNRAFRKKILVHRLIIDSWSPIFDSESPKGFPKDDWAKISREAKIFIGSTLLINHKDHNKTNNNILNLERVTSKQNSKKAIDFYDGNFKNGRGNGRKFIKIQRRFKPLTQKEKQVLKLMCEGLSNKVISELLKMGLGTTRWHVSNILYKLGTPGDRKQAIAWANIQKILE